MRAQNTKPWYREPWPWFLISLPATAVAAGITTVWIAATNADGLVVGDYYKAGDAGWFCIRFVPQNPGENFIGLCPNCE